MTRLMTEAMCSMRDNVRHGETSGDQRRPRNLDEGDETMDARALGFLLGAMTVGPEQAIRDQEAQGHRTMGRGNVLPANISDDDRRVLAGAGVVFHGVVDGDPLFEAVTLPAGWMIAPTDHPLWSDLLDADGEGVASIFYKAAFYDRDAFIRLSA